MKLKVAYVTLNRQPGTKYITNCGPINSLFNKIIHDAQSFVYIQRLRIESFSSDIETSTFDELSMPIVQILNMKFKQFPILAMNDINLKSIQFLKFLCDKLINMKDLTITFTYSDFITLKVEQMEQINIKRLFLHEDNDTALSSINNLLRIFPKLNSLILYDKFNKQVKYISARNIEIQNVVRKCCYLLLMIKKTNNEFTNYIDRYIWLKIVKDVYSQIYDNNNLYEIGTKLHIITPYKIW